MNFESSFKSFITKRFLKTSAPAQNRLRQAIFYTLFAKGSRFRPQLCFAATKALGQNPKKILPWAIAIEMIHGASLIHDDLPSMDNAQTRRGKKSNHLIFGEDMAILAGTCLFIESFSLLNDPLFDKNRPQILSLLISKIGFKGLMSGQALDLYRSSLKNPPSLGKNSNKSAVKGAGSSKQKFFKMIQLKTGSLIEAAILGPLLLWGKTQRERKALTHYSKSLGRAYQLADDLKDKDNFFKPKSLALEELRLARQKSLQALEPLGKRGEELGRLLALWENF